MKKQALKQPRVVQLNLNLRSSKTSPHHGLGELIGVILGLIAGQIMARVPSGYFGINVTTIGLLVVTGGFAGFLSPARKVSIVLMLIGFFIFGSIVGLIDSTNFDANYFIGIGFYLGVPLAGFVAQILYWIKVIK